MNRENVREVGGTLAVIALFALCIVLLATLAVVIIKTGLLFVYVVSASEIDASGPVPDIHDVCFSVTNYWPFDENNQVKAYAGQADGDPHHTAAMVDVSADREWEWVAAPLPLLEAGAKIKLPWIDDPLPVWDTFGAEAYQAGVFWHDGYGRYVIGVDVFTKTELHYLECGGEIVWPSGGFVELALSGAQRQSCLTRRSSYEICIR